MKGIIFSVLGINNTKRTMKWFLKTVPFVCRAEWAVVPASPTTMSLSMARSPSAVGANTSQTSTAQHLDFRVTPVSSWRALQHSCLGNSPRTALGVCILPRALGTCRTCHWCVFWSLQKDGKWERKRCLLHRRVQNNTLSFPKSCEGMQVSEWCG